MSAIRVELELADGSFTSRMIHAGETVDRFNTNVLRAQPALARQMAAAQAAGNAMGVFAGQTNLAYTSLHRMHDASRGFLSTMRDVSIVVGLAGMALNNIRAISTGVAGDIIKVNSEMESLRTRLASMSNAADPIKDAGEQVAFLRNEAKTAPFALNAIAESFTRMKATGIDPTTGSLRAFEDAVAAAGGGDEKLNRVSLAISQMAGKGVIQMEELRQQLGEALPRATELMARSMGVTYGQLVKEISTGTVSALPALNALEGELQRTFGGAAQRQMQTFQGQVSRMQSQWQDLALTIGDAGYFDAVKKQLTDLNAFLASPRAAQYARSIGEGLTSVVNSVRATIDRFVELRNEILLVAQVAATAFIATRAVAGITALTTALAGASAAYRTFRAELAVTNAFAALSGQAAVAATGVATFSTALAATGRYTGLLLLLMRGLAGPIGLVAVAVATLATSFGLFESKTRNAYDELEKFGAKSREQIDLARQYVAAENERIAVLEKSAARQRALENSGKRNADELGFVDAGKEIVENQRRSTAEIETARRRNAERLATIEKQATELAVNEARDRARQELAEIDKQVTAERIAYDNQSRRLGEFHDRRRAEMLRANQDTTQLDEQFQNDSRTLRLGLYEVEIAALDDFLQRKEAMLSGASASEKKGIEDVTAEVTRRINGLADLRRAEAERVAGIVTTPKEVAIDSLLKKGNDELNRLKASTADYRAELSGASGDAAKLAFQLKEAMKFGDPNNSAIKKLIEELLTAQKEGEKLKSILDGRNELEADYDRAIQASREKELELTADIAGKKVSEADKINARFMAGGYAGYNPETAPIVRTMRTFGQSTAQASMEAQKAAETLRRGIFGDTIRSTANTLLDTVNKIADAFQRIATNSGNINLSNLNVPQGLGGVAQMGGAIWNQVAAPLGRFLPASIRTNNPGAMWPGAIAAKWGATSFQALNDGTGQGNKAAVFPTKEAGAAAQFDLLASRGYIGKTVQDAITKWSGGNSSAQYVDMIAKQTGIGGDTVLTPDLIRNPQFAIPFAKAMARMESGREFPLDDSGWQKAFEMFLSGGPKGTLPGATAAASNPATPASGILGSIKKYVDPLIAAKDDILRASQARVETLGFKKEESDFLKSITADLKAAKTATGEYDTTVRRLNTAVEEGKFGPDFKETEAYKKMLAEAQKVDAELKRIAESKKAVSAATASEEAAAQKLKEVNERLASATSQFKNPLTDTDPASRARLIASLDEMVNESAKAYGRDSENYRKAQAQKTEILGKFDQASAIEKAAAAAKENLEAQKANMTTAQRVQFDIEAEKKKWAEILANQSLTAEQRVQIEKTAQESIARIRSTSAASDPLQRQLREWGDFQTQMSTTAASWLDSSSDALAGFVTGAETDFKALIDSMIRDMARLAIRSALSGLLGGGKGATPGAAGGKAGLFGGGAKAGAGGGGAKALFGRAHTGGIIGASRLGMSFASPMAFAGAPRFHTGGIIRGLGIGPDEVPIIAKRGEGVFTPDQMKAMGGSSSNMSVTNNVTLNANGGSPEQNADLAKQVSASIEATTRQIVVSEMQKQMRPGGTLRR